MAQIEYITVFIETLTNTIAIFIDFLHLNKSKSSIIANNRTR